MTDWYPPDAFEIARWAVDAHNNREFHASPDPLKYDDSTRAWCVIYMDMDFEQGFLFEIYTTIDNGFEVCDFLAVWDHHNGDMRGGRTVDVEWFNDPRLFFDGDGPRHEQACLWFVSWLHELKQDTSDLWARANPEQARSNAEYNEKHRIKRHAAARAAGVPLAYLYKENA